MKRFIALALVILLFALAPAALAADTYVCFIALNDSLLQLTSQAYSQGGQYYVPASVFAEFRVYADYQATLSTARVYNASKELFFTSLPARPTTGTGTITPPRPSRAARAYTSRWTSSAASSGSPGAIYAARARATSAASRTAPPRSRIRSSSRPPGRSWPAATANSPLRRRAVGSARRERGRGERRLPLLPGLPSAAALDTLDAWNVKAAFFLTRADIVESPETVRRIAGEGHGIGILCSADPASEFPAAESVLMEAANCPTVMIAASSREYDSACRRYAAEAGLAFCAYTIDGVRSGAGMTAAQLSAALSAAARRSSTSGSNAPAPQSSPSPT